MVFPSSSRRHIRFIFLIYWVLCFDTLAFSAGPVEVGSLTGNLELGPRTSYVEDPRGSFSLNELTMAPGNERWVENTEHTLTFGYTGSVYWFKTELVNVDQMERSFYVEIAYPVIDYITVHVLRKTGRDEIKMGDKYPFAQRPVDHRNFVFPLTFSPNEPITLIVRVETTSSMQIPLYIHSLRHFVEKDQKVVQGLGMYYGAMVIMILYNFFVYLSVRERNYLYYVFYVTSMTVFLTSLYGTSYQYLWPRSVWWNDQVLVVSLNLTIFFGLLFTGGFLKIMQSRPRGYWLFVPLITVAAMVVLFSYQIPYRVGIKTTIVLAVISIVWATVMAITRLLSGYYPARIYTLAWITMLGGGMILALNKFGLVPRSSLTENATLYGSVLEVVLLSFALADRLNLEKKERIEAQNLAHIQERNARIANENALLNERRAREAREQAFEVQKKARETLEQKVKERTLELNETLVIVREANNQVMSSLRYARMIQQAMLPQTGKISEWFPKSFIWWQPRDIVGGDFYYIDAIEPGYIVAVADCTGHGVPGAFMTLIANSELKRIVRGEGCYDPGEILTRMNRRIRKTLKQDTDTAISDDGLDIGICVVRKNEAMVEFAGARIDLVRIGADGSLFKVRGDRSSVGYVSSKADYVYPGHRMDCKKDMMFYMYTDGLTDQIGEATGRRFGIPRLIETLQEIVNLAIDVQFMRLKEALETYRGGREQMDDMTMIAFGGME